jgi:hypothetical protein
MKKMPFILMIILAVLALASSACLAQGDFLKLENQGSTISSNLTSPSDSLWVFLYLPLGKYRFDTSIQLDQMNQNKVSPTENDKTLEQKALTLQFSIKW